MVDANAPPYSSSLDVVIPFRATTVDETDGKEIKKEREKGRRQSEKIYSRFGIAQLFVMCYLIEFFRVCICDYFDR